MRIIGLLSWYDEDPLWLQECIAGAAQLCDYIVAVDGAYAHFPGGRARPNSPGDQHEAIIRAARAWGIGLSIHGRALRSPWDSEVAKRNFMFQWAKEFANPHDWFFRIDADEVLTRAGYGTHEKLAATPHDVAEVLLWDRTWSGGNPLRALFRNVPDLRIEKAHYHVKAYEDAVLVGPDQVEAEELWDIRLEHRTHERTPERLARKAAYNTIIPELESL